MAHLLANALTHLKDGQTHQAIGLLSQLLERDPEHAEAWLWSGVALAQLNQLDDAEQTLRRSLTLTSKDWRAHYHLGRILVRRGRPAASSYRRAAELAPDQIEPWIALGAVTMQSGDLEAAKHAYGAALDLVPDHPDAIAGAAELRHRAGDLEGAWTLVLPFLSDAPSNPKLALVATPLAVRLDRTQIVLATVDQHLDQPVPPQAARALHHARGTLLDHQQAWGQAFEAFATANALREHDFDIDGHEALLARCRAELNPAQLTPAAGAASNEQPVLLIGAPRSGTTVTEQVLACHPQVHAAGELPLLRRLAFEAARLGGHSNALLAGSGLDDATAIALGTHYTSRIGARAPRATRIVDKMPHNLFFLPLAARILPGARVIVVERDPVDTCWSAYRQFLGPAHAYSTDLDWLGRWYRSAYRYIDHWADSGLLRVHRVIYEDLVRKPEPTIRALLDFLDLPYDARCLTPHQSPRVAATASVHQVNRPLSTQWIGRSNPYSTLLHPLLDALGRSGSKQVP